MTIQKETSWKLESLRLTVFLEKPIDPVTSMWWKSVTSQEPETTTNKRQTGEYIDEGVFEEWRLTLITNTLNQNRIDWIAYPSSPNLQSFSTIGNYADESKKFFGLFNSWLLNVCPSALRLAYGAVLLNDEPDKRSSYETLESYLPMIKFDLESWSEFAFQVNNLTASKVLEGEKLNALSKWNGIKMVHMQLEGSGSPPHEKHACRLELDLSSPNDNKEPINSKKLSLLYEEMSAITDKYASKGYRE